MDAATFQRLRDPLEFRKWYRIPTDAGPRPWIDVAEPQQIADHDAMIPAIRRAMGLDPGGDGPSAAYWERPRAGGKTTDMGMTAANIVFGSPAGTRQLWFAVDEGQAKLGRDSIDDGVRLTPGLEQFIAVQSTRVLGKHNGSDLTIMASHLASSWGPTPSACYVDELTHWSNEELLDSVISSWGKSARALLIIGSNAGLGMGNSQHWRVRELFREDPTLYFGRFEKPPERIMPRLAQQEKLMTPSQFRRVWLNEWQAGSGDALPGEKIRRAIVHTSPLLYRQPEEWTIAGVGVDAGYGNDASSVVGVLGSHRTGKLRVVQVVNQKTADLGRLRDTIVAMGHQYLTRYVAADPWQMLRVCEELGTMGFDVVGQHQTGNVLTKQASSLLEAFNDERIELYSGDPASDLLVEDLFSARIVERSYGYKVESPRNEHGHGDRLSALLMVLPAALEALGQPMIERDNGPSDAAWATRARYERALEW